MLDALKILGPLVGTIVTGWFAYRIGITKAAAAAKTALAEAETQAKAAAASGDESAVQGWSKLAAEYRGQFETMHRDLTSIKSEVDTLRSKIAILEQERDQHRFWRLIGVDYINACLALLNANGIEAPPQPPGLKLTE